MAPAGVSEERELTHHKQGAADLPQIAVHPSTGIREDAQPRHTGGQSICRVVIVLPANPQQDQQAGPDLTDG
jgi:hypothetical protein